jgi:hypothetical protein
MGHPWPRASRGILPLGPLRETSVQPAPKSRFVSPVRFEYEDQDQKHPANAIPVAVRLAGDLPRSGSKPCARGVPDTARSADLLPLRARSPASRTATGSWRTRGLLLAEGRGSKLARDLPRSGSKSCDRDVPDTIGSSDFTAATRIMAGSKARLASLPVAAIRGRAGRLPVARVPISPHRPGCGSARRCRCRRAIGRARRGAGR